MKSLENCPQHLLAEMMADMINTLITHNDKIPLNSQQVTRFHSKQPPNISVLDYFNRICKYASIENPSLVCLLVYIDRLCERNRLFTISSLTIHRFIITALTISSKSVCDLYCTNSLYAKVGGLNIQELNTLELDFMFMMDWRVATSEEELERYYLNLWNRFHLKG
eukprot:NODE_40_length_35084_cov_0.543519.p21 type:complete len:166 gc:universal NODE_40_length_35084_cov_0.543519:14143-14640(+)